MVRWKPAAPEVPSLHLQCSASEPLAPQPSCLSQRRVLTAGPGTGSGPLGRLPAACSPEESGLLPSPIPRDQVPAPPAVLPENDPVLLLLLRAAPLRPAGSSTRSAPLPSARPNPPTSRRPFPPEPSRSRASTRCRREAAPAWRQQERGEKAAPKPEPALHSP